MKTVSTIVKQGCGIVLAGLALHAGAQGGNPAPASNGAAGAALVLVEGGKSLAPIIVFSNAPPLTRHAAGELASYIEKTSGAKPEIITNVPAPLPAQAIWVGYQPVLKELFPKIDFDFKHPEEILIAANEKHLVIIGRDVWDPKRSTSKIRDKEIDGFQWEYGTHNAVYTFLHDYINVRWIWPGEDGVDIIAQSTITFKPFIYRYHPQVRLRGGLLPWTMVLNTGPSITTHPGSGGQSGYWMRVQRLQLDSLSLTGGGFGSWWARFHETNPEYFALQPNGTRSLCTGPAEVKICASNPEVWKQWLDDVAKQLQDHPCQRMFQASSGDSYLSGHCICTNCRAWDHPDGELRQFQWEGLVQEYVALTDREITFANHLARGLKARFPGQELYVYLQAYGHSCPPPVAAVPDDNVIIGNVANFLLRSDMLDRGSPGGAKCRDRFAQWGKITKMNFWRPNTGSPVGWQWGLPDVPLTRTIKDMQYAAEHNWMGIYVDYVREHWSTQGPMNYLMAQLTWNPHQDGQAILKDYYRRAFGPAAAEMEAYWKYMEQLREECFGHEKIAVSAHDISEFYNVERLDKAEALLRGALDKAAKAPDVYRRRIEFVIVGLDFTRLLTECGRLMKIMNKHEDQNDAASEQIRVNWKKMRSMQKSHPNALRWNQIFSGPDASGPPSPKLAGKFHPGPRP